QDVVDDGLVLVRDGRDLLGHGEDNVEVFDRQEFGLSVLQPLRAHQRLALRTVPRSAAVERDALVTAGVALLDVAAERGGATALDVTHGTALPTAERAAVLQTIDTADLAEDVRHLQPAGTQARPQNWTCT